MKANEFVKLVGLIEAKRIIRDNEIKGRYRHRNVCHVELVELYDMVKSHELVEKHGGLVESKIYVGCCNDSDLLKAIADVESCM